MGMGMGFYSNKSDSYCVTWRERAANGVIKENDSVYFSVHKAGLQ